MTNNKKSAVLLGIAGSNNAFSLSLYNIKACAYQASDIRDNWNISIIQHPLVNVSAEAKRIPELVDRIAKMAPDLLGLSCYMWNVDVLLQLTELLRERLVDVQIVWGGPEMARQHLCEGNFDDFEMDYCISGEGEATFCDLLRYLSFNSPTLPQIKGLGYREASGKFQVNKPRPPFKSLLELPSPFLAGIVDDEVLHRPKVEANLETQRGCNLRCAYCIYHKDMSKISYSNVDRAMDEIRFLMNKGVKRLRFVDANFTSNLDHAKAIMRGMIEEKYETRLFFELIPGFIDEEFAELIGKFNTLHPWNEITCGVGVQTINLAVLKKMRRAIRKEKFEKTFELLQKHKVFAKIDLIIGLPGEDILSIERTLEYMLEKLRFGQAHLLCCHVMRGLPGTQLLDIAKEHEMVFSSEREAHELVRSPILPRADMVKCLRRTAMIFRLTNHKGWANREFNGGGQSDDTSIRDLFFDTRDRMGVSNVDLIDLMVEGAVVNLRKQDSWFADDDFPYAETWWWTYSAQEIKNQWILDFLHGVSPTHEDQTFARIGYQSGSSNHTTRSSRSQPKPVAS